MVWIFFSIFPLPFVYFIQTISFQQLFVFPSMATKSQGSFAKAIQSFPRHPLCARVGTNPHLLLGLLTLLTNNDDNETVPSNALLR